MAGHRRPLNPFPMVLVTDRRPRWRSGSAGSRDSAGRPRRGGAPPIAAAICTAALPRLRQLIRVCDAGSPSRARGWVVPGMKTVRHHPSECDRLYRPDRFLAPPSHPARGPPACCPGTGQANPHGRRNADMTAPRPAEFPAHSAMFAALAVPNFRRYVSGQSLSLIGTWVETVAQALLVLRLTHSGIVLGLTTAARYAPILLLSPYAGLL